MSDTSNRARSFSFSDEPSILSLYIQVKRQLGMGTRRSYFHCDISAFTDFVLVQSVLRDTFIDICINVSLTLNFNLVSMQQTDIVSKHKALRLDLLTRGQLVSRLQSTSSSKT